MRSPPLGAVGEEEEGGARECGGWYWCELGKWEFYLMHLSLVGLRRHRVQKLRFLPLQSSCVYVLSQWFSG